METLTVNCPGCKTILIVDKKTGQVIEVRKPIVEESSGNRFEDARAKVLGSSERAEKAFEDARKKESEKMAKLEALFKEKKDELKDKPVEKPERPMDFD